MNTDNQYNHHHRVTGGDAYFAAEMRGSGASGFGASASASGRMAGAGGSHGRGSARMDSGSKAGGAHAGASGRSAGRPPGSRQNQTHYSTGGYGTRRGRRKKHSPDYRVIAAAGVVMMLAITAGAYGMRHGKYAIAQTTQEAVTEPTIEPERKVTVDGVEITGLPRDEAKAEILKKRPWGMKIAYEGETYEVSNLVEERVDLLLDQIYGHASKESYALDTSGLEDAIRVQVAAAAAGWDKDAKNGSIARYEPSDDSFVFEGESAGVAIDQEKLVQDIAGALKSKKFDAVITASAREIEPEISVASAKEKYKTIGTYTTKTTANAKRNTNVRLACEALNGIIVQPGQEISFNDTVGERTEAKGYKAAAAYNNGEVVEEIGGGVCQVSTTLYNAVLKAGLKIAVRRSHTFEPSYVTPGQDATVSWGGPDFKFVNNSNTAIGIRAAYADQTCTVSVYGIPVLEEGVTYSLDSAKVAELDPPAPVYEEDQTLQPGVEVQKSAGTKGSRWETRLVIKKGDEVISRDVDHTATYKGHAPVIKRNTSGVVIPAEGSAESSAETSDAETRETEKPGTGQPAPPTGNSPGPGPGAGAASPDNGPGKIETTPIQEPLAPVGVDGPGASGLTPAGPAGPAGQ